MRDTIFLLVALVFFGAAAAYVRGCVALVGEPHAQDGEADDPGGASEVAA